MQRLEAIELKRKERWNKVGQTACESAVQLQNDAAAHLFLLEWQSTDAWAQIDIELETDLEERSPNRDNIARTFYYDIQSDGSFVSLDSGQEMQTILDNSLRVAWSLGSAYGVKREQARTNEAQQLEEWLAAGGQGFAIKSSLYAWEITEAEARKLNFKPEKKMSVITIYSVINGLLKADFFTLMDHDSQMQAKVLDYLGIERDVEPSSLEELRHLDIFNMDEDPVAAIRSLVGQTKNIEINANKLDEAKQVYKKLLEHCLESESLGRPTFGLLRECRQLGVELDVELRFGRSQSRSVLEQLRSISLPHFLYGQNSSTASTNTSSTGVYASSKEAVANGISYQGSCAGGGLVSKDDAGSASSGNILLDSLAAYQDRRLKSQDLKKYKGYGQCLSCQPEDKVALYGCGVFCKACNDVWCNEWERTGAQLEPKQVRMRRVMAKPAKLRKQQATSWFWASQAA